MKLRLVLPVIPEAERPPLVVALLGIIEVQAEHIQRQQEQIELLKDEIRFLVAAGVKTVAVGRFESRGQRRG